MDSKIDFSLRDITALRSHTDRLSKQLYKQTSISKDELRVLSLEIDKNLKSANKLDHTSESVASIVDTIRKDLQTAFEQSQTQFLEREINDITQQAEKLALTFPRGAALQDESRRLRRLIVDIRENHSLSRENRQSIQFAEQLLDSTAKPIHVSIEEFEQRTLSKRVVLYEETTHDMARNADKAIALCEIAQCFYEQKLSQAFEQFNALRREDKIAVNQHIERFNGSMAEIQSITDIPAAQQNLLAVARGCIAHANHLAGNACDPSEEEVHDLFQGLSELDP